MTSRWRNGKGHPRHTMMHIGQCPNPNFVYRFPIYCTTYAIYTITTPAKQPGTHQPFPPSSRIILHITWHCNLILYIRRTCKKNHFRFSFCVLLQNTPSPPPTLRILRRRYEPENITKLLVLFKIGHKETYQIYPHWTAIYQPIPNPTPFPLTNQGSPKFNCPLIRLWPLNKTQKIFLLIFICMKLAVRRSKSKAQI